MFSSLGKGPTLIGSNTDPAASGDAKPTPAECARIAIVPGAAYSLPSISMSGDDNRGMGLTTTR